MADKESVLEMISQITELNDLSEYMKDPQLDRAMELTINVLMEKGAIPQSKIPAVIVELQALATVFALKSVFYITVGKGGSQESMRKNVYFTANAAITKLCDSLKYIARS